MGEEKYDTVLSSLPLSLVRDQPRRVTRLETEHICRDAQEKERPPAEMIALRQLALATHLTSRAVVRKTWKTLRLKNEKGTSEVSDVKHGTEPYAPHCEHAWYLIRILYLTQTRPIKRM